MKIHLKFSPKKFKKKPSYTKDHSEKKEMETFSGRLTARIAYNFF